MSGVAVPRVVRVATALAWALGAAGLLLILVGVLELHWWGSPDAVRMQQLFTQIKARPGIEPPVVLRGKSGAVELIVLGVLCCAYGGLAPLIARGRRWARTLGVVGGLTVFFVGLVGIGVDETAPEDLNAYFHLLTSLGSGELVTEITPLLYPAWYAWIEDIAQGLQALLAIAAVVALIWVSTSDADFFASRKGATAEPDEWESAFSKLHRETVRRPEHD